ncbi:MAG: DUF2079 domain-containing protein [Salinivirgaceae bacterium]|nr:DUF2079 domain-containing protein [Salinivirgaceae bacterium]
MTRKVKRSILIGVAALLSAMLFNFLNTHLLKADGIELRDGQTVITADDASYLSPADNFLENGVWRANSPSLNSYYLRSPGYGGIYLILKYLFPQNPLFWLKFFQILLFAVSAALLYCLALKIIDNELASVCVAVVYGCTPFACGFLSYTLTEGVTPAFVIAFLFLLSNYVQNGRLRWLYASAAVIAILFIIRPVLGLLLPLLPLAILLSGSRKLKWRIVTMVAASAFVLLPMTIWQVRNYNIANQFVGLHPIYSTDSPDLFRPAHKAAWNFARTWSPRGNEFHSAIGALWQSVLNGDTTNAAVERAVAFVPQKVTDAVGNDAIIGAFTDYQKLLRKQAPFFKSQQCVPQWFVEDEKLVVARFDSLTCCVRRHCPLMVHITGPLKVYGRMALHSNLSMYMFQKTLRGNVLMEFFRVLFFLFHGSLFVLIWVALAASRRIWPKFAIYTIAAAYLVYLTWFQRGIEERYTLPMLPILMIAAGDAVVLGKQMLNKLKYHKQNSDAKR